MATDASDIVAIIIRNPGGEFFVHKRSAAKSVYPGLYGPGAGGHIHTDESPDDAAKRELFEETGIASHPKALFSMDFSAPHANYKLPLYEVTVADVPSPEISEWQDWGWRSVGELKALIAEGKVMPDTMKFLERYFADNNL